MTPAEQAAAVYDREDCQRTFRQDVELHMLHGYIFSTPDVFVMGRPVNKDAPHSLIVDPSHVFPREQWNCWLLYLAAGRLGDFWRWEPFPLDFIAWERKNVLRIYYAQTVKTLCSSPRFSSFSCSSASSEIVRDGAGQLLAT